VSSFDEIERSREFNEGLAYDRWIEDRTPPVEEEDAAGRVWPAGILSRVSREAYYAVTRARAFPFMTPEQREAAAVSYDQLKEALHDHS
jgi:hypothetical protein